MKKTVIEYVTGSFDEDIPRHILQENKIRLNAFFLEQETIQKKRDAARAEVRVLLRGVPAKSHPAGVAQGI